MAPILRHLNSSEQKTTFSPQRTLKINQLHGKLQHWPTHFSREVTCCNFSKSDWSVQNTLKAPCGFRSPWQQKSPFETLIWRKSHWCSENILSLSRCYKYSEINFPLYTSISTVVSVFLNVLGLFWRKILKHFWTIKLLIYFLIIFMFVCQCSCYFWEKNKKNKMTYNKNGLFVLTAVISISEFVVLSCKLWPGERKSEYLFPL